MSLERDTNNYSITQGAIIYMVSFKSRSTPIVQKEKRNVVEDFLKNPDEMVYVKTNRIYAQIARVSRDPLKQDERACLINVLEEARTVSMGKGKGLAKDPPYVVMSAGDIVKCFGHQIEVLPRKAFICEADINV